MRSVDTKALRAQVSRADTMGTPGLTFPLQDVLALADELDLGKAAAGTLGRLADQSRECIRELLEPASLSTAENSARRKKAKDLLKALDDLLEPKAEKPTSALSRIILPGGRA